MSDRRPLHPRGRSEGALLTGVGALLVAGAVVLHRSGDPSVVDAYARALEVGLVVSPGIAVCYGGYRVWRRPPRAGRRYGVLTWCVSLAVASTALAIAVVAIEYRLGVTLADPGFVLLIAAAFGAAGGTLTGVHRAEHHSAVFRTELQQDTMRLVSRLVRHHVLNAIQAIQICTTHQPGSHGVTGGRESSVIGRQSERLVAVATHVGVICETLTDDRSTAPVSVGALLARLEGAIDERGGRWRFEVEGDDGIAVDANDALVVGLVLVLGGWVGTRSAPYVVSVSVTVDRDRVDVQLSPGEETAAAARSRAALATNGLEIELLETLLRALDGTLTVETDPAPAIVLSLPRAADHR